LTNSLWQKALLPPGNEDYVWELFHENSKNGRHSNVLSKEEVQARIKELHESLPFEGYPIVALPQCSAALTMPLGEAITTRVSSRDMKPSPLTLSNVATIMHYAYGVARNDIDAAPRALRTVPSGGALYPLEIFFHSTNVDGLLQGLYHFNPSMANIRFLRKGNATETICGLLLQPNLAVGASLVIFITAIFERSIFKYQDRGYRYILLEAGHVAQNINLVATALGLGGVNIGGFLDRETDNFLDLDGVTHSTIYMIAVGGKDNQAQAEQSL
jgi:SagB-type dehydrogenase family enzyme